MKYIKRLKESTNEYDFYQFSVTYTHKRDFIGTKIPKTLINSEFMGYKTYGYGMYAKKYKYYHYTAILGYMDAPFANDKKINEYIETLSKEYGVSIQDIHVKYVARD